MRANTQKDRLMHKVRGIHDGLLLRKQTKTTIVGGTIVREQVLVNMRGEEYLDTPEGPVRCTPLERITKMRHGVGIAAYGKPPTQHNTLCYHNSHEVSWWRDNEFAMEMTLITLCIICLLIGLAINAKHKYKKRPRPK
jgi:hypothetical protein